MDITEPELAKLFAEYSALRAKFVGELEDRVKVLREEPVKGGTPGGTVHRAWIDLQAALAANEVHAILNACEQGEDLAVKAYGAALAEPDLDDDTRRLIQSQYESVQAAHSRVRQLRDSSTYAYR